MPPKGSKLAPPAPSPAPTTPAAVQQQANFAGIADYELPKTSLTKLAKGSVRVRFNAPLTIDPRQRQDAAGCSAGAAALFDPLHQLSQSVLKPSLADEQLPRMFMLQSN